MTSLFPENSPSRPAIPSDCITITGSRDVDPTRLEAAFESALAPFTGLKRYWLLGGAIGVDDIATQWLLDRGELVTGVVPFLREDQPRSVQETLARLTGGCFELALSKTKKAYLDRNSYMVDHSTTVIAFWNGEKGGTWQTIQYALKNGRETHVYPVSMKRP
jgi:predicted Rossmann fold nucleotide-binding protein DprA/Smf involved in DNA uptake